MITLYRKKPLTVQAVRLSKENVEEVSNWCGGMALQTEHPVNRGEYDVGINIPTLEGNMRASEGDFVIRGIQGEFYPCKPHIFLDSYEEA